MTLAVEVRDLTRAFGDFLAVDHVTFDVPEGEIFGFLGPNGAGKTTTIKIASGQMPPTSGCVHVAGTHVNGAPADALSRAGVCTIPEGRGIFPNLTVRENLRMVTFGGVDGEAVEEVAYTRFPRLGERRHQLAGSMSGGEQQMLSISRALATSPALLMLDEFSMGLAPIIVQELYEIVKQIAREGVSILLVEQFAHIALSVADYAAVMTHGRIQAVGQPADVEAELSGAYLGGVA